MEKSHPLTPMVVLTSERASSPRLSCVYFFSFVCGTGCIVYTTLAAFLLPRLGSGPLDRRHAILLPVEPDPPLSEGGVGCLHGSRGF